MKFFIIIILFLTTSELNSQSLAKWYSMDTEIDIEHSWCPYSSTICDSTISSRIVAQLDFVESPIVSSYNISQKSDTIIQNYRSHLYGVRGSIGGKQVLIIDSDMDNYLNDEKVIFLPELKKDNSIPYEQFDFFPSKENYNFNLGYEVLQNGYIHEKSSNIGIKVNHYLNKKADKLNYRDQFQLCFNQKLILDAELDRTNFSIKTFDYFPWINAIQFDVSSQLNANKKVDFNSPFYLRENGIQYVIDSLDLINNKILISESNTAQEIYLYSESLFSLDTVNTDSTSSNMKLIHFWGSWCIGCLKNFPLLNDLRIQHPNLELIGICLDKNKEKALETAYKYDITWKNLYYELRNEETFISALNILSYPTYLVVKDNTVIERFYSVGEISKYLNANR